MTPQPGIELLDLVLGTAVPVVATDLAGNIVWYYNFTDGTKSDIVQPIRLLPNGHFLVCIGPASSVPIQMVPPVAGTITVVREIDLAGNTIREISLSDLNTRLATAGFNLVAQTMHHDVLQLANGHCRSHQQARNVLHRQQAFDDYPAFPERPLFWATRSLTLIPI